MQCQDVWLSRAEPGRTDVEPLSFAKKGVPHSMQGGFVAGALSFGSGSDRRAAPLGYSLKPQLPKKKPRQVGGARRNACAAILWQRDQYAAQLAPS